MKKKNIKSTSKGINAFKVSQWLKDWDLVEFDGKEHRATPGKHFYMFSLSARQLRALSGVNRRDAKSGKKRSLDLGIQRSHEPSRSKNIAEYIKYGYPWSDLTKSQRKDEKFNDLRKPGWLPTAIVVNILKKDEKRDGENVDPKDLVTIRDKNNQQVEIILPTSFKDAKNWEPSKRHPIEVIDGQHRLLAFDEKIDEDYELPVVAFFGLDLSWQAYLFWTINIKPKRINPSLAFDLYPLLRTEEWLERFEGHKVYREARAQEIVESLWSEQKSVWYHRINMLGESGGPGVTQAAWVRALLKTYIKAFEGRGISIGGLFGAPVGNDKITIPWNRSQQAAFLICLWNEVQKAVEKSKRKWATDLRDFKKQDYKKKIEGDPAFTGPNTLLNNDQGLSVVLNVTNDLIFFRKDELKLQDWKLDAEVDTPTALSDLQSKHRHIYSFISQVARALASFDWRSSGAVGLSEKDRTLKLSFRGGSGYREFRRQLLKHLFDAKEIGSVAKSIYKTLGFEKDASET